jgi:ribosomal protein L20A (L18A)
MLRKGMPFRSAAREYTAALEKGIRTLAQEDVLDGAYVDMASAIQSLGESGRESECVISVS